MVRTILAVIAGYVVMILIVFLTFSVAYLVMGANVAFKPASFEPSVIWIATSFLLSLAAAVVGGYTCALIARGKRAAQVLAGIIIVVGLLIAIASLRATDTRPSVRTRDLSTVQQAMQYARTPGWVALLTPFVGAAGVLAGAALRKPNE